MMKFCSLTLLALLGVVSSEKVPLPEITIGLNSDALDKGPIGVIEPTVNWETSGKMANCDVQGGISVKMEDKKSVPYSVWGKVKRNVGGVDLSGKVDTSSSNLNYFGLDVQAAKGDTKAQLVGSVELDQNVLTIEKVQVSQNIKTPAGSLTLMPSYNFGTEKADIQVAYGVSEGTVVTVNADKGKQKVTVSQSLGDQGEIIPSLNTDGALELEYRRNVGNGALTAAYKPNDSLGVSYEEGPWVANVKAAMDGYYKFPERVKVSVRRAVDVSTLPMP